MRAGNFDIQEFVWNGEPKVNRETMPQWFIEAEFQRDVRMGSHYYILIVTKFGTVRANPGDHIVRFPTGDIIPMREDLFQSMFETSDLSDK